MASPGQGSVNGLRVVVTSHSILVVADEIKELPMSSETSPNVPWATGDLPEAPTAAAHLHIILTPYGGGLDHPGHDLYHPDGTDYHGPGNGYHSNGIDFLGNGIDFLGNSSDYHGGSREHR